MADIHQLKSRQLVEDAASLWIARLEAEDVSDADRARFKAWLNEDSMNQQVFSELRRTWHRLDALANFSHSPEALRPEASRSAIGRKTIVGSVIAAAAAVVCAALIWQFPQISQDRFETMIGEQTAIELADGSVVQMNTNTAVEVHYTATERVVALTRGEAHFDVEKDASRPFVVKANGGMIRAVGTAFNVHVLENRNVEVTVTEGVVEVLGDTDASVGGLAPAAAGNVSPARITRNQRVSFDPKKIASGGVAAVPVQNIEREMAWRHGMLSFDGQTLEHVIREVGRYTDVRFEFASVELREVRVGGYFKATDTDALLELLSSALNIRSQKVGDRIVLSNNEGYASDPKLATTES